MRERRGAAPWKKAPGQLIVWLAWHGLEWMRRLTRRRGIESRVGAGWELDTG